MHVMDVVVLIGYFATMIIIGALCARMVKKQEDFFMGGRGFGKLLQTFAAFGAGTGAQDPINVGRTTWTSGLSGVWSALMWLFVTPFYWIIGVWYRRMRHITLGDWFVERYESRSMGAAYAGIAFCFVIFYLSSMFSAISKVAAPLLGDEVVAMMVGLIGSDDPADLKYVLVPLIGIVVIAYGVVGGLAAAYWTDLIQGICIILLSIILIPYGLWGLVEKFGDPETMSAMDGFRIMHEQVAADNFQLFGGPRAGEFPLHYIVSLTLLALVGVVVQPHFIATGGGTAKNEEAARIGLVTGNFLKRICTIGWALTALIVVALLADSAEIARDPERVWGIASREILGNVTIGGFNCGLVGLMLACLLAALMSSADCYMLIISALLVRNVYAPFINADASERTYVNLGRVMGLLMIVAAIVLSVGYYQAFNQYRLALEIPLMAAAPFWVGMFWRRATRSAAWTTIAVTFVVFFLVPIVAPIVLPGLSSHPSFAIANQVVTTRTTRAATPADVARRDGQIAARQGDLDSTAPVPVAIQLGNEFVDEFTSGGKAVFWTGPVNGRLVEVGREESADGKTVRIIQQYEEPVAGSGLFNVDYLVYWLVGVELSTADNAMLQTLRLPPRMFIPFLVMIIVSLVTKPGTTAALDRYYAKMKTPVSADPEEDELKLAAAYGDPRQFENRKLFPGTNFEMLKPSTFDVMGFVVSVGICFVFLAFAHWLVNIGAG